MQYRLPANLAKLLSYMCPILFKDRGLGEREGETVSFSVLERKTLTNAIFFALRMIKLLFKLWLNRSSGNYDRN